MAKAILKLVDAKVGDVTEVVVKVRSSHVDKKTIKGIQKRSAH